MEVNVSHTTNTNESLNVIRQKIWSCVRMFMCIYGICLCIYTYIYIYNTSNLIFFKTDKNVHQTSIFVLSAASLLQDSAFLQSLLCLFQINIWLASDAVELSVPEPCELWLVIWNSQSWGVPEGVCKKWICMLLFLKICTPVRSNRLLLFSSS